jgi:hypothetical protein
VQVFNSFGGLMSNSVFDQSNDIVSISFKGFASGTYYLQIVVANQVVNKKIQLVK